MRRPMQALVGLLALAVIVVFIWPFTAPLFDRPAPASARTVEPISVAVNVPSNATSADMAAAELDVAATADVAAALPRGPRIAAQLPEQATVFPAEGALACPTDQVRVGFRLTDAMRDSGALNPSVVWLTVDGADVPFDVIGTRDFPQSQASLVFTGGLPAGVHEATVYFPDEAGETWSYTWTFETADDACGAPVVAEPAPVPPVDQLPAQPSAQQPAPPVAQPPAQPPAQQPAPPAGQPTGPPPPPVAGTDVLHFRAEQTAPNQQGQPQTSNIEFWFDPASFATRLTVKGTGDQGDVSTVCSGREVTTFNQSQKRAESRYIAPPDATGPILCPIAGDIFEHKMAMDAGAVQPAGEESVDGVPAWRIESTSPDGNQRVVRLLEKSHGLLLRETVFQKNESGQMQELGSTRIRYTTLERIPKTSVAADTFSTGVSSDWISRRTRVLSEAEARAFTPVPLYWVGLDFAGMGLVSIEHEELSGPPGRLNTVTIQYAQPPSPDQPQNQPPKQLIIFEAPPAPTQGQTPQGAQQGAPPNAPPGAPAGQPQPRREQVTVGTRQGTLITIDQGPTTLEITIGQTFIAITGPDRATVMQAAQALARV